MQLNTNYQKLEPNYLFTEIALRTAQYQKAHPDAQVIKLGIGDVTRPLPKVVANAIKGAIDELTHLETFRGYGPEVGYRWAREAVVRYYAQYNVPLTADEITIGDGIGEDLANITDIFAHGCNRVLIPDPVYPLYNATSLMDGDEIHYMPCTAENDYLAMPPNFEADLIYICSPNNPTAAAYNEVQLQAWVDYANACDAVILYDAAYERFITEKDKPHSIFCIPGARTCAIEFGSLSKTAGFTSVRSGYTVIPAELQRSGESLNKLWKQRQTTKYNGAPYATQRGLEAALSPEGLRESDKNIAYYRRNMQLIHHTLEDKHIRHVAGVNSPYVWMQCPDGMSDSWAFFDAMLNEIQVVGTPGVGFGSCGQGCFRFSGFNTAEQTAEAMKRLHRWI